MIQRAKITHGDFRNWSMGVLYEQIEKVINAKQARRTPYYIMARLERGYSGTPVKTDNHILTGADAAAKQTKDMDLSGKIVLSSRLVLMDTPPLVPMINTMLWKVDNIKGTIDPVYVLPLDAPVDSDKEFTEQSDLVDKSGQGMPLAYNKVERN